MAALRLTADCHITKQNLLDKIVFCQSMPTVLFDRFNCGNVNIIAISLSVCRSATYARLSALAILHAQMQQEYTLTSIWSTFSAFFKFIQGVFYVA